MSPEGLMRYTAEYNQLKSERRAKEEDEQGAYSPRIFSPLRVKHNRPLNHVKHMRKLQIVDFESSDESESFDLDKFNEKDKK